MAKHVTIYRDPEGNPQWAILRGAEGPEDPLFKALDDVIANREHFVLGVAENDVTVEVI